MSAVTSIAQNATIAFEHTPVNLPALIPTSLATMGLAICVVLLRLYTRHFLTKRLWWDDAIIFVALLPSIGLSVDTYFGTKYGWAHHAQDIPALEKYVVGVLKTLWFVTFFFNLSAGLIKSSILVFYLRITSRGVHRTFRFATWVTLALVIIWTMVFTLLVVLQCIPSHNFWSIPDYATRVAACAPYSAKEPFFLIQGITNIVLDFAIVILPIKYIIELKMPLRQRLVVITLLGLGVLAATAGIVRVVFLTRVFLTLDTTWEGGVTSQLGCLEMNVSIICASIPPCKPLIVSIFPRYDPSTVESKNTNELKKETFSSSVTEDTLNGNDENV